MIKIEDLRNSVLDCSRTLRNFMSDGDVRITFDRVRELEHLKENLDKIIKDCGWRTNIMEEKRRSEK